MPIFNPTLPVDDSLVAADQLRNQFNSLNERSDQLEIVINTKAPIPSVAELTQTISNPPTQAQVLAIQNKINQLIEALSVVP